VADPAGRLLAELGRVDRVGGNAFFGNPALDLGGRIVSHVLHIGVSCIAQAWSVLSICA
jgi:hypothetical protein